MHLLFLLVSSEEDAGLHLAVLKKIALLVENPDFYRRRAGGAGRRGRAQGPAAARRDPRLSGRLKEDGRGMDILEQLLVLEKQAAGLVAAAETEAGQRKAAARVAAQADHAVALKQAATEAAVTVEAERGRLEAERVSRNDAHRAGLTSRTVRAEALAKAARRFLAAEE